MFSRRLIVPFIVAILSSCTAALDAPHPATLAPGGLPARSDGGVVAVGADGAVWVVREGSRTLERWVAGSAAPAVRTELPILPLALRRHPLGGVVALGATGFTVVDASGVAGPVDSGLDATGAERLDYGGGRLTLWTAAGRTTLELVSPAIRGARLLGAGRAAVLARDGEGESLYLVTPEAGAKRLAGPFASVDSFDIAPDGGEIVFSARRGASFDIGLVAAAGSDVRWIGPDPLDERSVRWAPRGNKLAYVIETPGGAVIRSVHIPTGFQVSAPLPLTEVSDLAWDAEAERLALLVTSADAGERVELMRYDGTERREVVPATSRAERPDQLAGVPEALLFPPEGIRYNEKLPLVVWAIQPTPFAWSEARARVQQNRRIGSVVVARGAAARPALWEAIAELPWVDPAQVFLVAPDATGHPGEAVPAAMHLTMVTRELGTPDESERVSIVRSGSGELEEFAVLWLSERLRGYERENDGH
jgi:hypothetical protein